MSLDVWLTVDEPVSTEGGSGIFVRENGSTKEISREEWDEKFPGREPFVVKTEPSCEVFEANITHNLSKMAQAAGLRDWLWAPEEVGAAIAEDLIPHLERGLIALRANPQYYKGRYNPENGWGTYEGLVEFTERYLKACRKYPTARIGTSR